MQTLNLTPAVPGQPCQFTVPVNGFGTEPTAGAELKTVPGGRSLQNEVLAVVKNDSGHPTAWRVLVTIVIVPLKPVWVEVTVNQQIFACGWLRPQIPAGNRT